VFPNLKTSCQPLFFLTRCSLLWLPRVISSLEGIHLSLLIFWKWHKLLQMLLKRNQTLLLSIQTLLPLHPKLKMFHNIQSSHTQREEMLLNILFPKKGLLLCKVLLVLFHMMLRINQPLSMIILPQMVLKHLEKMRG
jgi:hypothetical protein